MRVIIYILLFFNLPLWGQQNLVPNPSFEEFNTCPQFGAGEIFEIAPWFDAMPPNWYGSSDFFHPCITINVGYYGAPNNLLGYQYANTGDGYAGVAVSRTYPYIYDLDKWREYIETPLTKPLIDNRKYCVSWYAVLANNMRYGVNRIGAYFSSDTLYQTDQEFLYIGVIPQIENLEIVTDTLNWTRFSQSFAAIGGEQFMTVGNFRPSSMVDTSDIVYANGGSSYYYFDDFAVYELPELEAGISDSIFGYETTTLNGSCIDCWNGLQFTWEPSQDFEDPYSLTTQVSPDVTTTYYLTVQDTTGTVPCMDEVRDSVTIYVKNGPDFIVFPNPSIQDAPVKVYIGNVGGGSLTIRVHDIKGKLIYEKLDVKPLSTHELDLKLSAGLYTVTLNSEVKIVETKKLVIEE